MKKSAMTPLQREELRLTELLIQNLEAQLAQNPNYVRLLECRAMIASLTQCQLTDQTMRAANDLACFTFHIYWRLCAGRILLCFTTLIQEVIKDG